MTGNHGINSLGEYREKGSVKESACHSKTAAKCSGCFAMAFFNRQSKQVHRVSRL